jgi:ADP-heptose:LPS heptosyltransferase
MEFLSRLKLVICNEGGPLHIAVSQNVSTISIFGPVDDNVYGPFPLLDKHKVVKAEQVDCRPCYNNFRHKRCETHDCLTKIDRDEVLKLALESLKA